MLSNYEITSKRGQTQIKNWNLPIENFLTFLVSMFAVSIYFSKSGLSVFGIAAILTMVLWRFVPGYSPVTSMPKSVVLLVALFLVDFLVSALMSEYSRWVVSDMGKYRHLLFGGLLYAAPLSSENRKVAIVIFFISAAFDGLTGVLQNFGLLYNKQYSGGRPLGNSSDAILYAADLALAFGAAIVMIFIGQDTFKSKKEKLFLIASAGAIFMGILVSGARGVWVALLPACFITLYHYGRKSAFIFLSSLLLVLTIAFSCSNDLVKRTSSIVTSFYTENEAGSTGNRLELWKGSYLMFRQSPLMGVGSGDFEAAIKRFIAEKKLNDIPATGHAHNIYFQALATRGLIGFGILVALFTSVILWGRNEIKAHNEIGGYVIIVSTLLAMMGGLTENNMEIHRYLAAFSFTIGLIGPYGASNDNSPLIKKSK